MEGLPIEVLTEIFSHFDDESMWNAMKVCKIWTEVFTTSTKLNERFQLQITKKFIETQDLSNLPNIPIKNISIIDVNIEEAPRLDFLKSQTGSLKELKLHRLPFDTDGGEVLKFIIEEMNLENFYYGEIPLILNGQKQKIEEIWVSEASVNALMEIFRQFPMIKTLRLTLIGCSIGALHLTEVLSLPTNLFNQLQELIIIDNSRHEFQNFVNLYKNCKNIKRLTIETKESKLSELFKEFLPIMTQLEEFKLICDDFDINKRLEAIRENCLSLKVLKIKKEHLENARRIFNDFNNLTFEII